MLDKKSVCVLKTLKKLANDNSFKVVTLDDVVSNLTQKIEPNIVKQIIDFLFEQEYINIKFCEDNTYCYAIQPKANDVFVEGKSVKVKKKPKLNILNYVFTAIAAFVGSMVAMLLFFLVLFR